MAGLVPRQRSRWIAAMTVIGTAGLGLAFFSGQRLTQIIFSSS